METNQEILVSQQIKKIIDKFNGLKRTSNEETFQFAQKNCNEFVNLRGEIIKIESLKENFDFFKETNNTKGLHVFMLKFLNANQIDNPDYNAIITDKEDRRSKQKIFNPNSESRKSVEINNKDFNAAITEFVTVLEAEKNKALKEEKTVTPKFPFVLFNGANDIYLNKNKNISNPKGMAFGNPMTTSVTSTNDDSIVHISFSEVPSEEEFERQLASIKTTLTQSINDAFSTAASATASAATAVSNNIPSFDLIIENIDFSRKLLNGTATAQEIENQLGDKIQGFFNGLDKTTETIKAAKDALIVGFNALKGQATIQNSDSVTSKDASVNPYATQPLLEQVIDALVSLVTKAAAVAAPAVNNAASVGTTVGAKIVNVASSTANYVSILFSEIEETLTLEGLIKKLESGLTASGEKNIEMNDSQINKLIEYSKTLGGLDDNSDLIKNLTGLLNGKDQNSKELITVDKGYLNGLVEALKGKLNEQNITPTSSTSEITPAITYALTPVLDVKNFLNTDFNSLSDSDKIGKIIESFEKLKVTQVSEAGDEIFKFDSGLWESFHELHMNSVGKTDGTSDGIKSLECRNESFNFGIQANKLREKGAHATAAVRDMLDNYFIANYVDGKWREDQVSVDVSVQQYNDVIDGYVGALKKKKAEIDTSIANANADSNSTLTSPSTDFIITDISQQTLDAETSSTKPILEITTTSFTKLSVLRKMGLLTLMFIPLTLSANLVVTGAVIGLSFVKKIEFLKVINDEVILMHESLLKSYSEGVAIGAEVAVPVLLLALVILSFFLVKAIVNKENYFVDVKGNIAIVEAQNKDKQCEEATPSMNSELTSDALNTSTTTHTDEKPSETKFKLSIPEKMMNFVYLTSDSKALEL